MEQSLRTDGKLECGDPEFAREVLHRYADMVYRLALSQMKNPADADDVFQEVFLRLVRKRPSFQSEEHLKAWLIRVTINCARKFWGSAWTRHTELMEYDGSYEMPELGELAEAVLRLPKKYRAVIHLYYYEGYSSKEIGRILHLSASSVTSRLSRARKMLKDTWEGEE